MVVIDSDVLLLAFAYPNDDRLLKLAKRNSKKLDVRVENPLVWVEEMI